MDSFDRIIGVLGGMGPEATEDLFHEIIALTPAARDQDHIRVLIYSNPKIPDRTRAIVEQGADPVPEMIESAKLLEKAGAGILVIPCNAAHHFVARLQPHLGVPVLNMIEETCRVFRSRLPNAITAGLLAATGTVKSGIYRTVFSRCGVSVITPMDSEQVQVQSAILSVKAGNRDSAARRTFQTVADRLAREGAEAVILGCTEIPLALEQTKATYPTLNPTRILAQAAVDWALGRRD